LAYTLKKDDDDDDDDKSENKIFSSLVINAISLLCFATKIISYIGNRGTKED
jgi:hypothetical protein